MIANQLTDPRRAVDVRDDLEEEARLVERPHDRRRVELAVLEAHGGGRNPDASVVQRSDQRVPIDLQIRARQLLRKTPELASSRHRRMVVQKHEVDVAAHLAAKSYRDDLTRLGVVAVLFGMRMNSYLTIGSITSSGSGTTRCKASMSVR